MNWRFIPIEKVEIMDTVCSVVMFNISNMDSMLLYAGYFKRKQNRNVFRTNILESLTMSAQNRFVYSVIWRITLEFSKKNLLKASHFFKIII